MGNIPRGIPNAEQMLADLTARVYELERRLRDDVDVDFEQGCCASYCAFKSGSTSLAAGATGTLTFNIKRPTRGRVQLWGAASAMLASGTDLFFGGRLALSGTFYDPRITERNQAAAVGDRVSVSPVVAVDFAAGADAACTFEVANHSGATLTWLSGAFIAHVFYTREGSLSCSPPIGGTGV